MFRKNVLYSVQQVLHRPRFELFSEYHLQMQTFHPYSVDLRKIQLFAHSTGYDLGWINPNSFDESEDENPIRQDSRPSQILF